MITVLVAVGAVALPQGPSSATGVQAAAQVAVVNPTPAVIPAATWRAYRQAIIDSTVATPEEVVTDLLVPTPADARTKWRTIEGEQYLLVGLLRREPFANVKVGDRFSLSGDRWVSVPGQLDQACANYRCSAQSTSRLDQTLKQINGLPPDADYRYVVRFWIKATDLFRPCTDPRVSSASCPEEVTSASATAPVPTTLGTTNLASFLWQQTNYAWRMPDRFQPRTAVSCAKVWTTQNCYGFPWTRLGYTYDWSPKSKDDVGLTEFVAVSGATAYLEAVGSQREFFPRG